MVQIFNEMGKPKRKDAEIQQVKEDGAPMSKKSKPNRQEIFEDDRSAPSNGGTNTFIDMVNKGPALNAPVTRSKANLMGLKEIIYDNNNASPVFKRKFARKVVCRKGRYDSEIQKHHNSNVVGDSEEELDYIDNIDVSVDLGNVDHEIETESSDDGGLIDSSDEEGNGNYGEDNVSTAGSGVITFKQTGQSSSEPVLPDFNQLRGNPAFETYIKKCVAEEVREATKKHKKDVGRRSLIPVPKVKSVVQKPSKTPSKAKQVNSKIIQRCVSKLNLHQIPLYMHLL